MPRRSEERRLRNPFLAGLAALALACVPSVGRGQAPPADSAEAAVRYAGAAVDLELRVGRIAGESGLIGGVRALVAPVGWLRVGGGGHRLLREVGGAPAPAGSDLTLTLGYGGLVVEVAPDPWPLRVQLLGGAGLATLRDRVVGTRVDSEVVGVLESKVDVPLVSVGRFQAVAGAGYRWVFDAEGPGKVTADDLRSPFLTATVRLSFF